MKCLNHVRFAVALMWPQKHTCDRFKVRIVASTKRWQYRATHAEHAVRFDGDLTWHANFGTTEQARCQMPEWREVRAEDNGKYAFVERLPRDAPPALLVWCRALEGGHFRYWTTGGWAALTSRVCVCERPEET